MQVLIGDSGGERIKRICQQHGIGRMLAQNWPQLYENEPYGFDNGAWGFFQKGEELCHYETENGEVIGKFLTRLNRAMGIGWPPYMAILPDIVGGGDRSLEVSLSWVGKLPDWPWYLAVQDGMTVAKVIDSIHLVDGIFLGGTDAYKQFAGYWRKLAHHFKKRFHYGRAGTMSKLAHAIAVGADSLDSAFPLWTKDRLWSFIQALGQQRFDGLTVFAPHPERGGGHLVELEGTGG